MRVKLRSNFFFSDVQAVASEGSHLPELGDQVHGDWFRVIYHDPSTRAAAKVVSKVFEAIPSPNALAGHIILDSCYMLTGRF